MKIIVHRGIDQIGGCITEIATGSTRILIDLGQNLPDNRGVADDRLANREAVAALTSGIDAIFYTHYHGDHLGLFHYVPDHISQYIGTTARRVALCKHRHLAHIEGRELLSAEEIAKLEKMFGLSPAEVVKVGDIKVTPYLVSHSAYEAYMFLIEADGRKVLHTGDFRGHGYLSKGLLPTIEKLILPQGPVDLLVTEGTMLSRPGEQVRSERELGREIAGIMRRYKNVFVLCSSTDMERLATFQAANKQPGRGPLVCDGFQKSVLELFTGSAGRHTPLFRFDPVYDYNPANTKLSDWMVRSGFCMFVRATDKFQDYYRTLAPRMDPAETVLIYSMWREYVNPHGRHAVPRYLDFVSLFPNIVKLHTSGHADPGCLAEVCNRVDPALGIVPIHSEDSAAYVSLPIAPHLEERIVTRSTVVGDVQVVIRSKEGRL